jgi:hypothetical protein
MSKPHWNGRRYEWADGTYAYECVGGYWQAVRRIGDKVRKGRGETYDLAYFASFWSTPDNEDEILSRYPNREVD